MMTSNGVRAELRVYMAGDSWKAEKLIKLAGGKFAVEIDLFKL